MYKFCHDGLFKISNIARTISLGVKYHSFLHMPADCMEELDFYTPAAGHASNFKCRRIPLLQNALPSARMLWKWCYNRHKNDCHNSPIETDAEIAPERGLRILNCGCIPGCVGRCKCIFQLGITPYGIMKRHVTLVTIIGNIRVICL